MLKIYVTCFWKNDSALLEDIRRYGFGKAEWKNLTFTDKAPFDVAVVLTSPSGNHLPYNRNDSITIYTEPPQSEHHRNTTNNISSIYLPLSFWIKEPTYETILFRSYEKQKLLSTVTSDLGWLEGHQRRSIFIHYLDRIIEEGFDIYGKSYNGKFLHLLENYRGELKYKFEGLLPYCYHFTCENSFLENYFTEKIVDPILAESLCFYDGCTNIETFIDDRSFIRIDISQPEVAAETICRAIQDNEYSKRFNYIKDQKKRLLTTLNPLNMIWAILRYDNPHKYLTL